MIEIGVVCTSMRNAPVSGGIFYYPKMIIPEEKREIFIMFIHFPAPTFPAGIDNQNLTILPWLHKQGYSL